MVNRQIDDAIALIPAFNGKNMPLSSFIRTCKRARRMIPEYPEELFTQTVVRKLYDAAYVAVDGQNPRSLLALCSRLRQKFGTYYSFDHHRAELKNILMAEYEPVIDYIARVQDLHEALLDEERYWGELTETKQREIDDLALKSFWWGLPLDYHPKLNAASCISLREAYDKAIKFHVSIQYERDRRGLVRPQPQPKPRSYNNKPMDYYYFESKRVNNNRRAYNNISNARPAKPPPSPDTCNYCGKVGHAELPTPKTQKT